jgi:glycosyltransferase involved in cell wall biosynthesis
MTSDRKIVLKVNSGPIVFFGSMNTMPMMYAIELKKLGYEVIYFVDSDINDLLSRPENHFPDISYPYPSWIVEIDIKSQMIIPFFGRVLSFYLKRKVSALSKTKPQLIILNGFFISLSKYFTQSKLALSHGSDLDTWADVRGVSGLKIQFSNFSIFKYLPNIFSGYLIEKVVRKQFNSLVLCDLVAYFPSGFNALGDRVINQLELLGVNCTERFDISFESLKTASRNFNKQSEVLNIFSGVRFTYKTFSEGNEGYGKGNDIIIRGLARYYQINKNIEIHFVEKGPDTEDAKRLCANLGIDSVVIWHKEMKFKELIRLFENADVCFDQVGKHWLGAIGFYSLWLGKPLIANDKRAVDNLIYWPECSPVQSASTELEVFEKLCMLTDENTRKMVSDESKLFAEKFLGPSRFIENSFKLG